MQDTAGVTVTVMQGAKSESVKINSSVSQQDGGVVLSAALTGSDWQVGKAELTIRLSETEYDCCLPVSALHSDNGGDFVYSVEERNTIWGCKTSCARFMWRSWSATTSWRPCGIIRPVRRWWPPQRRACRRAHVCVQRDEDSKGGAAFGMRGFLGDRCLVCGEAVGSLSAGFGALRRAGHGAAAGSAAVCFAAGGWGERACSRFWSQAEGSAESRWETCGITAILYCGEYDAVYPAVLLEGRFPAAQENGKCAVSTAAAWQLWGSEDVLGQELEIEGDIYRVCGLFRSSASLALCGESLDHGFSNIEFWGGYAAPPVETVQQLLRAAGIAQQVTLYFPFPWMAALTAYALCPAGLVLLAAARTLGGRVRKGCPKETCWFVLGGAFLLALVLPALLRLLPPWITPARWSDFPTGAACCPQWAKP